MKKEYLIRNDLAVLKTNFIKKESFTFKNIKVIDFINNKFLYTNIIFNILDDKIDNKSLETILVKKLKEYLNKYNLINKQKVFIIGLGNNFISSDSLGVKTVDKVQTSGIKEVLNIKNNKKIIYTYIPGTLKNRGYMSYQGIKALKKELEPDFIIIIDSLVCDNIKYLNKTIQITDAGITPGSGIWNIQEEISFKTLKIPVIVIGVPTVVEASTIIKDALNIKDNKFLFESGYDFLVSSKDVDIVIDKLSKIISNSLNKLFDLNNFE